MRRARADVVLRGLLGAGSVEPEVTTIPPAGELERLRAIQVVHGDLKRTLDYLEAVTGRVAKMRPARFQKPGAARASANALHVCYECIKNALAALERAEAGGPLADQHLELARHAAWIAATRAGGAVALSAIALPESRSASRARKLKALLNLNRDLSVARVNAMLPVPLDDSTARRIARELRGSTTRRRRGV